MSIAIYNVFWSVSLLEPFWSRVLGEKESDLEKAVSPLLHGGETAALKLQVHVRGEWSSHHRVHKSLLQLLCAFDST